MPSTSRQSANWLMRTLFFDTPDGGPISCPSGNRVYLHPITGDLQQCSQTLGFYNETSCPGGTVCERFPILIPGFQDYCCWADDTTESESLSIATTTTADSYEDENTTTKRGGGRGGGGGEGDEDKSGDRMVEEVPDLGDKSGGSSGGRLGVGGSGGGSVTGGSIIDDRSLRPWTEEEEGEEDKDRGLTLGGGGDGEGGGGGTDEDGGGDEDEELRTTTVASKTRRTKKPRHRKTTTTPATTTTTTPEPSTSIASIASTTSSSRGTGPRPRCNNPEDSALIDFGNRLRDCYFHHCMTGYRCEFNHDIRRFICCGKEREVYPPPGLPRIPNPKPLIPRPFRPPPQPYNFNDHDGLMPSEELRGCPLEFAYQHSTSTGLAARCVPPATDSCPLSHPHCVEAAFVPHHVCCSLSPDRLHLEESSSPPMPSPFESSTSGSLPPAAMSIASRLGIRVSPNYGIYEWAPPSSSSPSSSSGSNHMIPPHSYRPLSIPRPADCAGPMCTVGAPQEQQQQQSAFLGRPNPQRQLIRKALPSPALLDADDEYSDDAGNVGPNGPPADMTSAMHHAPHLHQYHHRFPTMFPPPQSHLSAVDMID